MRLQPECLPCTLRQAIKAVRLAGREELAWPAMRLALEVLREEASPEVSPPWLAQRLQRRVRALLGGEDPYAEVKRRSNRALLARYAELRRWAEAAGDPLLGALRLAGAANALDVATREELPSVEEVLERAREAAVPDGSWRAFLEALGAARSLLYVGDNAGEVVLDRLLLEAIAARRPGIRLRFLVRGAPVLNDVTAEDAAAVGMSGVAEVVSSGSDLPAFSPRECEAAALRAYRDSDMILAKGQGNFEALHEERRPVWFLFQVKCPVVARAVGQPLGRVVLLAPRGC